MLCNALKLSNFFCQIVVGNKNLPAKKSAAASGSPPANGSAAGAAAESGCSSKASMILILKTRLSLKHQICSRQWTETPILQLVTLSSNRSAIYSNNKEEPFSLFTQSRMSTATHRSVRLLSSAATKHSSFSDSGLLAEELVNVITQPFPKNIKCKQTLWQRTKIGQFLLILWFLKSWFFSICQNILKLTCRLKELP